MPCWEAHRAPEDGGQELDLSRWSFTFLVFPVVSELPAPLAQVEIVASEIAWDLLGWAGAWACCVQATGALSPGEACSWFALEMLRETVFSGR